MYCTHCGSDLPNNGTFCPHCGGASPYSPYPSSDTVTIDVNTVVAETIRTAKPISIGSCLRRAWTLVMPNYWVFFGTTLLAIVCMSVFVINFIVIGGLYYYYLGRIRHQPRKLEDLFIGFQRQTLPLILGGLVQTLISAGIAILIYGILFIGMFLALGNEEFVIIGLLVIILEVPLIFLCWYLSISWIFSFPLIIERRFKFWDAMEVSRRVAGHQFWRLLGFSIVLGLIGMLGIFCCYVGIFFVIPLNMAAFAYLYEDLFGGLLQETDRDMIEIN